MGGDAWSADGTSYYDESEGWWWGEAGIAVQSRIGEKYPTNRPEHRMVLYDAGMDALASHHDDCFTYDEFGVDGLTKAAERQLDHALALA